MTGTTIATIGFGLLFVSMLWFALRFNRRPPRPQLLHPDAPWPPSDNPWARKTIQQLSATTRPAVGIARTTVFVDDGCSRCVIERNNGGEIRRHRNPDCDPHNFRRAAAKDAA